MKIHILEKYYKNGIYVRKNYDFKRKGIKFYTCLIIMKILGKEIDILEEN